MASLSAARPYHLIHRLHRPSCMPQLPSITLLKLGLTLPQTIFFSRFENGLRSQLRQRLLTVHASNSNPSGGDSLKDKSDDMTSGAAPGPPFLTILAGFLVIFAVCWVFGSIIMWLFGLIVKVPALK